MKLKRARSNRTVDRAVESNQFALGRAHRAHETAQSIAADRRNAREAALQNVHLEINQLAALPSHPGEFVVERLVPVRFQAVAQSKVPNFLRGRGILDPGLEPQTMFEWANGYEDAEGGSDQQRIRVAQVLRGWLLPNIVKGPLIWAKRTAEPFPYQAGDMVVVSDHRSWAGSHRPHNPNAPDMPAPNVIGVLDNEFARFDDHAVEGISAVNPGSSETYVNERIAKLEEITAALAAIRMAATRPPRP